MLSLLASQDGGQEQHLSRRPPASEEAQVRISPNPLPAEEGRGPQGHQTLGSELGVWGMDLSWDVGERSCGW